MVSPWNVLPFFVPAQRQQSDLSSHYDVVTKFVPIFVDTRWVHQGLILTIDTK